MRSDEPLRREALAIFLAGVDATDPRAAVSRHLRRLGRELHVGAEVLDLDRFARVVVLGAGKAAAEMAAAVEQVVEVDDGLVVVKPGHGAPLARVEVRESGHPVPDAAGVDAALHLLALADELGEDDLVITVVSGGGSALLPCPLPGLELDDLQQTTSALLACGATIHEVNTVRRQLSAIHGGRLAARAWPATCRTLVLSDVPGDALHDIASGPTVPDPTSSADARAVLQRYELAVPTAVSTLLSAEAAPLPSALLARSRAVLVGSNAVAVAAAAREAEDRGYAVHRAVISGEASDVGRDHAAFARSQAGRRACLVAGGESTVTLRGTGRGGRNQEVALAAAIDLAGHHDGVVLAAGTDGTDGPTDAAGAFADGSTVERAAALGLDASAHLRANDSYSFFDPLDDLLRTGPTRTNVMDLHVVLTGGNDE